MSPHRKTLHRAAAPRRRRLLLPQDLLHLLPLRQFVDELVEIADLAHQGLLDLLDADAADHALDQRAGGIEGRSLREAAQIVLSASIRHHARAPELSRELERIEEDLPLDDEVAAITDKVHAGLIGLLAEHALPAPEVVARDLTAMSRGMVHAALFAGETDLAQIERRLLPAILGYLGLAPRG